MRSTAEINTTETEPKPETDTGSSSQLQLKIEPPPHKPPFHPALLSQRMAYDNYDLVTSDHVPLLATVSVSEDTKLKFITWNVLQNDAANGFAAVGGTCNETKEQRIARHTRIAESLVKMIQANQPHFIALQEIVAIPGQDSDLYTQIIEQFRKSSLEKYICIAQKIDPDSPNGDCNIIFYDADTIYPSLDGSRGENVSWGTTTQFMLKKSSAKINIANVHAPYSLYPVDHEQSIKQLLNIANDEALAVVIGDFNCTVASRSRNAVTSVSPAGVSEDGKTQGAYSIDGCFYSIRKAEGQKEQKYYQADVQHLNTQTGKVFQEHELPVLDFSKQDQCERQQQEILTQRMVICVDDSYQSTKYPEFGNKSIFEYEQDLRKRFSENAIFVRATSNLNNQKGIGIAIPNSLYKSLNEVIPNGATGIQVKPSSNAKGRAFYIISTPIENIGKLIEMINLFELYLEIEKLKEKYGGENYRAENYDPNDTNDQQKHAVIKAFKELSQQLIQEMNTDDASHTRCNAIIAEHFSQEARRFLNDPKPNAKTTTASAKKLEEKLYGKPPMSPKMRSIVFVVFGALAGAVLGVAMGVVIPAGVGAMVGGLFGYNRAKGEQRKYQDKKKDLGETATKVGKAFNVLRPST